MVQAGRRCALGVVWVCVSILLFSGTSLAETLYDAAEKGDLAAVRRLLGQGAKVKARNKSSGRTPLHAAAYRDNKEVVELLIKNGADVNTRDKTGDTPLHLAAGEGNKAVAELLITNGADVNARTKYGGNTPLHEAARSTYSHYGVLELLISNGADVNARDKHGHTPLHEAADWGLPFAVELLIKNGADVNARTFGKGKGLTPYSYAQHKERKYIADLLRKYGGK